MTPIGPSPAPAALVVRAHPAPRLIAALLTCGFLWVGIAEGLVGAYLFAALSAVALLTGLRPLITFDGRTFTVRAMLRGARAYTAAAGERFSTDGRAVFLLGADGTRRVLYDRNAPGLRLDAPRNGDWGALCRAVATGRTG